MSTGAALSTNRILLNSPSHFRRLFQAIREILAETRTLRDYHRSCHPSLEW